jgi:hypothetical protein
MRVQFCILGHIGTKLNTWNGTTQLVYCHHQIAQKSIFHSLYPQNYSIILTKKTTIQQLVQFSFQHYTLNPFVLLKIHDTKIIHKSLTKQINLSVVPKSSTTTKKCIKTTRGGKQSLSTTL